MFHQASTCTRFLAGSIALAGLSLILITNAPAQQAAQARPRAVPQPAPVPMPGAPYSERLMIYYEMVPYGQGYAARLTQNPFPGSPLRQAQIQLEAGDTITALDDVPIRSAQQLEQHHSQTKVTFLNVRTNRLEARYVMLPPFAGPGPGPAPIPGPGPIPGPSLGILGAPVVIQLQGGGAGVAAAPVPGAFPPAAPPVGVAVQGLRITQVTPGSPAQFAGLRPGDTILTAGQQTTGDINALRQAIAYSGGVLPMTVADGAGFVRNTTAYLGGGAGAAAAAAPAPAGVQP